MKKEFNINEKEADSHLPLFGNLTNILFSNRITTF